MFIQEFPEAENYFTVSHRFTGLRNTVESAGERKAGRGGRSGGNGGVLNR